MEITKKTIEVTTYKLTVSNEERRTLMDALAISIDSGNCTLNVSLCERLFNEMEASNADSEQQ